MTKENRFPIATRRSPLALAQTQQVAQTLAKASLESESKDNIGTENPEDFPILALLSSGDKNQIGSLADSGGKGLFTKEIEEALLNKDARFAVHSMKDMPVEMPPGLVIAAIPPREDPRDGFICPTVSHPDDLPKGAIIGTASVRRKAQTSLLRSDLRSEIIRGNVSTRLRKCAQGEVDATFLAVAGLNRLGLGHEVTHIMPSEQMLPAIGQGALCIQAREDDHEALALGAKITCPSTQLSITLERAFLARLDGSCKTALAGYANIYDDILQFTGEYYQYDSNGVDITTLKTSKAINIPPHMPQSERLALAQEAGIQAANEILEHIQG